MLEVSLGIDTSNYKTSVAMVDRTGRTVCNLQKFLEVKKGERGLRQSAALFQHVNHLPELICEAFDRLRLADPHGRVACIAFSEKPRPIEGSYMPVFLAGRSQAYGLSAALHVPCYSFSHQEGHIEAVRFGSSAEEWDRFISFHFSGGTTEALLAEEQNDGTLSVKIIGGSRDLAFGQVLDRVGVALGMDFPCGAEMDKIAGSNPEKVRNNILPKIKCTGGFINLSGIETCCQRVLPDMERETLIPMLFSRICSAVSDMILQLSEQYCTNHILLAGGVSASSYLRNWLSRSLPGYHLCFGDPVLSSDNAVGIALLGGKQLWR